MPSSLKIQNSRLKSLLSFIFLGFLTFTTLPTWAQTPIKIGMLAFRPKAQVLEQWSPLALYLQQQLGRQVTLTAHTYLELENAVLNNELDIVVTNPAHYILLRHKTGLSAPLVTQINNIDGHELSSFGGVIFTRKNSPVNTLADIEKYKIAVTKNESLGGYQMQAYELFNANLATPKDRQLVITGMPHDKVVQAVITGQAEVGFVRSGVIESLQAEGKLNIAEIKVLNRKKLLAFPLVSSTRLYPEWPVALTSNVEDYLARQITIALLSLQSRSPAALEADIHGFTIPADYSSVEHLLRDLRAKPFDASPSISIFEFWQQHTIGLIILLGFAVMLSILGIGLIFQNRFIKKKEQHLLSVQDNLNSTLNAIPDSMFEIGLDGTYYKVWPSHSNFLAKIEKKLVGKRLSEEMEKEAASVCLAALQEANVNKFSSGHQVKLILNGEEMRVELSIV